MNRRPYAESWRSGFIVRGCLAFFPASVLFSLWTNGRTVCHFVGCWVFILFRTRSCLLISSKWWCVCTMKWFIREKTEAEFYEGRGKKKKGFLTVIEMNLLLPPAGSCMARHFSALCVLCQDIYILEYFSRASKMISGANAETFEDMNVCMSSGSCLNSWENHFYWHFQKKARENLKTSPKNERNIWIPLCLRNCLSCDFLL